MDIYGTKNRQDPDPAVERVVSPPTRQTTQTRVVETVAATAPVICSVYSTLSGIAGPPDDGTGPVTVNWNTESLDSDTMHDPGVNPNRITIPTGKPGIYKAAVRITWNSNGAASNRIVRIRVNGANVASNTIVAVIGSAIAVYVEHQQFMNAGDYYDIGIDATGGGGAATTYNSTAGPDGSSFVVTKQLV
jgi:hypothetical protein